MTKLLCVLLTALFLNGCATSNSQQDFGISVQLWSVKDHMKRISKEL
ncbi:MAG: hypothetical protein MK132_22215 [Lentisphaerales bacterium]|nr:hypothetical protein [Lentisphaerales bacterium]